MLLLNIEVALVSKQHGYIDGPTDWLTESVDSVHDLTAGELRW